MYLTRNTRIDGVDFPVGTPCDKFRKGTIASLKATGWASKTNPLAKPAAPDEPDDKPVRKRKKKTANKPSKETDVKPKADENEKPEASAEGDGVNDASVNDVAVSTFAQDNATNQTDPDTVLNDRTIAALEAAGLDTIGKLSAHLAEKESFESVPDIGKVANRQVKNALAIFLELEAETDEDGEDGDE